MATTLETAAHMDFTLLKSMLLPLFFWIIIAMCALSSQKQGNGTKSPTFQLRHSFRRLDVCCSTHQLTCTPIDV